MGSGDRPQKTILLVEDDDGTRKIMVEILSMRGFRVIDKSDAASALVSAQTGAIDLVVTDYRLPGVDGVEFLSAVRDVLPRVPVIMMTAYVSVDTYIRSMSLGVFEYLNKPVDQREFERIVDAALQIG